MGALPKPEGISIDVLSMDHGFMRGDHVYFCNESKEAWEKDLLLRAVIAESLSECKRDRTMRYIGCFKLLYSYILGMPKGKAKYASFNEPFWTKSNLEIKHIKPYYDWYADMPMRQRIEIGRNCSVELEKFGERIKQRSKGKVYETVKYGFRFVPDNALTDYLLSAAEGFAKQLLLRHTKLLLRYAEQIKGYMDAEAMRYTGYGEFASNSEALKLLIDATGVYVKCNAALPSGCQFAQRGLPNISLVQQFGVGLALRRFLEKVTKENPTQMRDGTRIFYSLEALDYDILDYDYAGIEKDYIGWVGYVRGLPLGNINSTGW